MLKQKLTYFGHVVRAEGLESSVMLGMGEGKRERGRPRTRWLDAVKSTTGLTLLELVAKVRDRAGWRSVVKEVVRGRSRPEDTR